jgi:tetratricopeptide (TPR) repeat protein
VHRTSLSVLLACVFGGLVALVLGEIVEGRVIRFSRSAALLLPLVCVPALQSTPLPIRWRSAIDPAGSRLLQDVAPENGAWPLSLDPPVTRADIGKAGLALAIFIVAFHLGSGKTFRHLVIRAVGASGVAAVVIGIGHKLVGAESIYGMWTSTYRTLVVGPFVNANHTAEFLELAAFACLACSFLSPTILNRVVSWIGAALCVGGVALTLSRGGAAAVAVGTILFVFLRYLAKDEEGGPSRRTSLLWGGFLLGLVALGVGALGAEQLIERFHNTSITSEVRFKVWRESLRILAAHPFGIGRGAFDRVFPIYRTLQTPFPIRFAFVENEPLQYLIDCGWLPFAVIAVSFGIFGWQVIRRGRRDRVEAALLSGLFAVLVHNLVDFGLETPGILLPFVAIAATVFARISPPSPSPKARWLVFAAAAAGCGFGFVAIRRPAFDNFDALLKQARSVAERRALVERARRAHPVDYFYALAEASLTPLKGPVGTRSPRLHVLNQALTLCPRCEDVHLEIARNLWRLGFQAQSLLEYRSAVEIQPTLFYPMLGELFGRGATATQLVSLAGANSAHMIEVARYLGGAGRVDDGLTALGQAAAMSADKDQILLARADLEMQAGRVASATQTIRQLDAMQLHDPRLAALKARAILTHADDPKSSDRALEILDGATTRYPMDVELQRARVDVVLRYKKWAAAARALDGFKQALYYQNGVATEGHLASARVYAELGRWTDAVGEYRIALADQPSNVALWMELGGFSAANGRIATAREAFLAAGRLSPNNPAIDAALKKLDHTGEPGEPH